MPYISQDDLEDLLAAIKRAKTIAIATAVISAAVVVCAGIWWGLR